MLNYYKNIISLRKTLPSLHCNNRRQLHVTCLKEVLTLHRWEKEEELICFMNFSKKAQPVMVPSNVKDWYNILDSGAPKWNGPQSAPEKVSGGTPGSAAITLQPESILIYMNRQVPVS
jgi:hypothetical protein